MSENKNLSFVLNYLVAKFDGDTSATQYAELFYDFLKNDKLPRNMSFEAYVANMTQEAIYSGKRRKGNNIPDSIAFASSMESVKANTMRAM